MARVLEQMPTTTRKSQYPWDKWADGQARELIQGEDFTVKPESIRGAAISQAKRRGMKVRTAGTANGVVIQFYKPE